jgi:hypothetical protein
MISLE